VYVEVKIIKIITFNIINYDNIDVKYLFVTFYFLYFFP